MSAGGATAERPPLAVTMGDPAGIGGEIVLKAWTRAQSDGGGAGRAVFFVIDDPDRLHRLARRLDLAVPVNAIEKPADAAATFAHALPVLPIRLMAEVEPGRPDPANAEAVKTAIETAVGLTRAGEAAAVVTNPIHKETLYGAGFSYPGHTEFLAALAGGEPTPVMMLAADALRVVPVTIHKPLRAALDDLTAERIVETGRVTARALEGDFGIRRPRIAVAGLNPHAGEGGMLGDEETHIIQPAVEALRGAGIDATGPVAPDALFTPARRETYDAALCMYHDQALIPIKAVAFERAVNVTLGLPFVRTSPDHGTAFDIAGTGLASEESLVAALDMASAIARFRALRRAA